MSTTSASTAWTKTGLVALPLYGLVLGFTTRKPQPDQVTDPEGWAQFVSSPSYLVEHIASSVVGAVLVIFGTLALGTFLTRGRAPRLALWGTVLAVAGQTLFMVPGTISTFATPAIGAAYLRGNREVMTIEFSPVLTLITGVALLLTVAGNIILGLAIWRSGVLAEVGRAALDHRHAGVLRLRGLPRNGHHERQPPHPTRRRSADGDQQRLDRLDRAPLPNNATADGSRRGRRPAHCSGQPLIEWSLIMTIPAADCPYLAVVSDAAAATTPVPQHPGTLRPRSMRSFISRHPVVSFLVAAYAIFWASWMPVLFLGAPPRLFSAIGAILGLALPAFLVTAATDGKVGVHDLMRRTLRWRVGIGWYLLAALAIPLGALLLAPIFLGLAPLQAFGENWPLLFTAFLPQLLLALVTVQFFEELGWAGFVQHRLQARHGALKASLLVALAFAFLHLPTYLRAPISGQSAVRDLSVLAIVHPVRDRLPDPDRLRLQPDRVRRPDRGDHPRLLQRGIRAHRPERPRPPGPDPRVRLNRPVGAPRRSRQQRRAGPLPQTP